MPAKPATTDIAPIDNNTAIADPYAGMEWEDDGVNRERVRPIWPEIKLVQGTTKGVAPKYIGQFMHSDRDGMENQFEEAIEVIPLRITDNRTFFEDGSESPSCVSLDGISPLPNQLLWTKPQVMVRGKGLVDQTGMWQPQFCAQCPYSQFGEDGEAPACNESKLMMVQRDDESFARFRVGRTGLRPVNTVLGKISGQRNPRPAFTYAWTFTSETVEKGSKKWNQLKVSTAPLSPEQARSINNLVREMREQMAQEAAKAAQESGESTGTVIDMDEDPAYE